MNGAVRFDKYDAHGDIHWRTTSPLSLRYNGPLVARYNCVLKSSPRTCKRILDIGCGDGRLTYLLGKAFPSAAVTGVDSEIRGIEIARERIKQRGQSNIKFEVNADGRFDFKQDAFDLIVMTDVIEHLLQPVEMLAEISRMLSPDGTSIITTPNRQEGKKWDDRHEHEFDAAELKTLLQGTFSRVAVYGSWPMKRIRWGKTVIGRIALEARSRCGFNPYEGYQLDPTAAYGQLTAVCACSVKA